MTAEPYYSDESVTLHQGDALDVLRALPDASVDCCVTSPPYFGLRDYGVVGQYGLEASPAAYVETMRRVFAEVRRLLADDGVLWLNIGDSYQSTGGKTGIGPNALVGATKMQAEGRTRPVSSLPDKNLLGIPWRVAFALQDDGWILRNAVVWNKPNAMPESVTDRLSTRYEHVFLFSKSRKYWFDLDAVREPLSEASVSRYAQGPVRLERRTPGEDRSASLYKQRPGADKKSADAAGRRHGNAYAPPSTRGQSGYSQASLSGAQQDPGPDGLGIHVAGRNPGDVWTIPTTPFSGTVRRTYRPRPDRHDPDVPAYGTRRIASPDCPMHESPGLLDSTTPDDGRAADETSRTTDTGDRHGPAPATDSAPTPSCPEPSNAPSSSDSQTQQCAPVASPRSNGTHRTDPDAGTTPACTPSVQSPDHTAHNEGRLAFDVPVPSTASSRTDGHVNHASDARKDANTARTCTCSWVDSTQETAHFAVMSREVARRCIASGCKPAGTVLDPFHGSGTTGAVAASLGRRYVGIDLNREYLDLSLRTRLAQTAMLDGEPA